MEKIIGIVLLTLVLGCNSESKQAKTQAGIQPIVSNIGQNIAFSDSNEMEFFKTEKISLHDIKAEFTAPGKIAATIVSSNTGASQNLVLFENPELTGNYTQLIQHQININQIQNINVKQKQIELSRIKDLQQHGAATGQDLLNAQMALTIEQSNLANERTALIEHESKLKAAGFHPETLTKANAGTAYIICDVPENQINKLKEGSLCKIKFTAFQDENYTGKIEEVADVVDNATRMIKLRISINKSTSKLKAGMFAIVSFGINEGNFISISKNSLVTIQGKTYVFVKTSSSTFERKEIEIGEQIGDRIIVFNGLHTNDEIAIEGIMQLKGLSFGY